MVGMHAIGAFFISLMVAYLVTPFLKIIAKKTNFLDTPNGRKIHIEPTPLLGGIALYLAFIIALLYNAQFNEQVAGILIGSTILVIVGFADDRLKAMPPQIKLLGQILAALTVVKLGIRLSFIDNNYLAIFISCFWIVGITNAFNLLDNMNGLSSGVAAIAGLFFALISFVNGQILITVLSMSIAGACIGFLRYNFPKAQIFMGDIGSLFIGFILSSIAILGNWKSMTFGTSIMIPLLVLGYPIFDTCLVTFIRIIEGRHIFIGGKDHSSHRLVALGLSPVNAILVIYAICAVLGLAALMMSKRTILCASITTAFVFLFFIMLGFILSTKGSNKIVRKITKRK